MGVAVGPDGSIFITDRANAVIRQVDTKGRITTVAGTGSIGFFGGDGGSATETPLGIPQDIVVGPDGTIYFTDSFHRRVRKISATGRISTVAGNGSACVNSLYSTCGGDGGKATDARINTGSSTLDLGLALALDGSLYIAAADHFRVRRIDTKGIITTVAGTGEAACSVGYSGDCTLDDGDNGVPTQAALHGARGLAVGPDNTLFIADYNGNVIRTISPALPGMQPTETLVAAEDGAEAYVFSSDGRHLKTVDALTGSTALTLTYDVTGRLEALEDAFGNITSITRTGDNPTGIVSPFGVQTELTVDENGYLSSVTNPNGEQVSLFTSSSGLLDSLIDPSGGTHAYTYDPLGRLIRDSDPAGGSTELMVSATDSTRTTTVSTEMGHTTTYTVKSLANDHMERSVVDQAGLETVTRIGPDGGSMATADSVVLTSVAEADPRFGMQAPHVRSFELRLPSGLSSTFSLRRRDSLSNPNDPFSLVSQTDSMVSNGKTTVAFYNAITRRHVNTSAEGRETTTTLDSLGRVIVDRIGGLDSIVLSYDAKGNLTEHIDGGRVTRYNHNAITGLLDSIVGPLNRVTVFEYGSSNRVARQRLPDGALLEFEYDSAGNLTALEPAGRPAHAFRYDGVGNITRYTPPIVGSFDKPTHYYYDLDRRIDSIVRPDSITLRFGYDSAGRTDSVFFDRGFLGFGYNAITGTLSSIRAPENDSLKFTYDGNIATQVTWTGRVSGSVRVKYNQDLQVDSQLVSGASAVAYSYDQDGFLEAAGGLRLGRNSSNALLAADTLGPIQTAYSYSTRGELSKTRSTYSSTTLMARGYGRDSLGRITQVSDTVRGIAVRWSYVYDVSGRLAADSVNGVLRQSISYDSNGNRLSSTVSGVGVTNYVYDDQDRLTMASGSSGTVTFSYTSNGELSRKMSGADTTHYRYDAFGNLVKVILPSHDSIEYLIDGQNRRVGRKFNGSTTHRWLYQNQLSPVAEVDSVGNVLSRFVYGSRVNVPDYMIRGSSVYRFIVDHLGSVRLVVDTATGTVVQWANYDGWGAVLSDSAPTFQPFGYAGGLSDQQTGLIRFGSRDYSPGLGRWTVKDPVLFEGGPNLYIYVENDPINYADPSGRIIANVAGGILSIALGAGIAAVTGQDYGWTDAGVDFAMGAIGTGIFAKAHLVGEASWKGVDKAFRYGKAVGERAEFSHFIPQLKPLAREAGGIWKVLDRQLNGVLTRGSTHALTDPQRYRFMPKYWKAANAQWSHLRKWAHRLPAWILGGISSLVCP
jgi:RHS repeat-associated protein